MNNTTDPNEAEMLEAFVDSGAWKWLQARFEAEWGRGGTKYLDTLERMANNVDAAKAAEEMQRVIWVRKEIEQFFAGVRDRLRTLKAATQTPADVQSRRGSL